MVTTRALLDPADAAEMGPPAAIRIPLDLIDVSPFNPRQELFEIGSLAENIKQFGQLQAILVRRSGDRFEVLGGHRRLAAFKLLAAREPYEPKWRAICATVSHEDDSNTLLRMLISGQVHISDWAPHEESAALEHLVELGYNASEIGESLNKSPSWASKRLRVYNDSVLSDYVQSGKLKTGTAEELLPVVDVDVKKRIAADAVTHNLTQDQVKDRVRALRLDTQLSQVGRLARQLLDILSSINPHTVPIEMARDLWTLHGRIEVLARGSERKMPTIEEAQRAAGVKTQVRPLKRGEKPKPGYKPKRYDDII